jgi:hypothetical protein
MTFLKIAWLAYIVVIGGGNQLIDMKHRKHPDYSPGTAWSYYAKLSKEGNWHGTFMIWSTISGIVLCLAVIGYMFYRLTRK